MTKNETDKNSKPALAWHFIEKTERYPDGELRDSRPAPEDGAWLEHEGPVKCCVSGLHASERLLDASFYAFDLDLDTLCRVECEQIEDRHHDKFACRRRRILWRIDPKPAFRAFARRCALDMAHLWDCPEVVLRYLKEGREEDREAAASAINSAINSAASAAYWATISSPLLAALEAADCAIGALTKTGNNKEALIKHYDQLLEDMVEELHQNSNKTWTF